VFSQSIDAILAVARLMGKPLGGGLSNSVVDIIAPCGFTALYLTKHHLRRVHA
jgi:hypothetical protein